MKSNRRSFLRLSAFALPFTRVNQLFAKSNAVRKPLVVSTWDSGQISNAAAWPILEKGGSALDAVEQGAIAMENEINCCVGLGGNPDRDGFVTLDACLMDDKFNCGSVAFVEKVKHPISLARKLMENTPHVFMAGAGAQQFAVESGIKLESGELSPDADKAYKEWLKNGEYKPVINVEHQQSHPKGNGPFAPKRFDDGTFNHDTMGTIAMDASGNLSGMCTTSGLGFKMRGRIGDSPIIGSGLYVDNEVGAATGSGQGEEVIRICGTHTIVELMRNGLSPAEACKKAIERIIKINPEKAKTFQVGFIAINKQGEIGAYSIQKGFSYTMTEKGGKGIVVPSKSHFS
ncbi:isoaspartyl peptidase/L-asparaginase family protein [Dyadobacter arcticus]|uniref:N4-(Beta-N-acetylglucosaminyl)-L-asparaginase n=1 Tax=Dyadobacter arcticus TaxID=1078754 RepID=A0ABX0UM58_9BACT|nr:N(4)-(beta-N-acetylglucosaminyl)-L-asparaginase [Dyadobacter arcticus]NIJ53189.1 N4-(beta-N-acetylglucosaminyl)-L-asparaginase [Dyadobacter arcticus]